MEGEVLLWLDGSLDHGDPDLVEVESAASAVAAA